MQCPFCFKELCEDGICYTITCISDMDDLHLQIGPYRNKIEAEARVKCLKEVENNKQKDPFYRGPDFRYIIYKDPYEELPDKRVVLIGDNAITDGFIKVNKDGSVGSNSETDFNKTDEIIDDGL